MELPQIPSKPLFHLKSRSSLSTSAVFQGKEDNKATNGHQRQQKIRRRRRLKNIGDVNRWREGAMKLTLLLRQMLSRYIEGPCLSSLWCLVLLAPKFVSVTLTSDRFLNDCIHMDPFIRHQLWINIPYMDGMGLWYV